MTRKIYCFGNPLVPEDSLALQISGEFKLDGWKFIKCRSPEELFNEDQEEMIILDVAKGIDEIKVLKDLSKLKSSKLLSLHDFDLSYFLQLLEKLGQLPKLKIIALPMKEHQDNKEHQEWKRKLMKELEEVLDSLTP